MPSKRKENIEEFKRQAREATIKRLKSSGHDLVIISEHDSSCPDCAEFQGKVFSLSGNDPEYPPLSKAIAGGLFHDGCRHCVSLSPVAADRFLADLRGDHGEDARNAEIGRLITEYDKKHPKKKTHGWRKWFGFLKR